MGNYVGRRLGAGAVVLVIVSMLAFLGLKLAPGDELTARMNPEVLAQLGPAQIQKMRHTLGLDAPLPVQYWKWVEGTVQGNLGWSSSDQIPVATDIGNHVEPTLILMSTAFLLGLLIALPFGILAAVRQRSSVDYVVSAVPLILIGIPSFVLALASIYIFSVYTRWLPTSEMHTPGSESTSDLIRHLVLPASILSIVFAVPLLRYTRAGMIDALNADYIVTARAKGLSSSTVILRHGFRNALIPIITVIALAIPDVIAGQVIVEQSSAGPDGIARGQRRRQPRHLIDARHRADDRARRRDRKSARRPCLRRGRPASSPWLASPDNCRSSHHRRRSTTRDTNRRKGRGSPVHAAPARNRWSGRDRNHLPDGDRGAAHRLRQGPTALDITTISQGPGPHHLLGTDDSAGTCGHGSSTEPGHR